MRFAESHYILALWLVPAAALLIIWGQRQKARMMQKFSMPEPLKELTRGVDFKRQRAKSVIVITALAFSVISLMRPQWGFQWQEVKRRGLDILIAIDTSRSMLAADVKPNRLERSKLAVRDLVKNLRGDRVALMAFSGTAFIQCPFTVDYSGFLLALNGLDTGIIPYGGTSISSAIKLAIKTYKDNPAKHKAMVIITDGEDHEGNALSLAKQARKAGIRIFCIGIGTREGELIQIADRDGKMRFLKDKDGHIVKSRLNELLLKKAALETNGAYVRSSGAQFGLELIYRRELSKMEKRDIKAQMKKRFYERFQIPLSLALLLLVIEPFISERRPK